MICLVLLLVHLGPSALVGFVLFVLLIPVQERAMSWQFRTRQANMHFTESRAKLLQELLASMRIIKYFCYEIPYLNRIFDIRRNELRGIRKIQVMKAVNMAIAFSVPAVGAILALITYNLSGRSFDPAIIFPSLGYFNLLRCVVFLTSLKPPSYFTSQPLMFLPRALSATADARSAFERLRPVFKAELIKEDGTVIDRSLPVAIRVNDASFQWEESSVETNDAWGRGGRHSGRGRGTKESNKVAKEKVQSNAGDQKGHAPFKLVDMTLEIPRGSLCALVGPVGSGKSSLLAGLLGETKRSSGTVTFGGTIAYCAQIAWIQNASVVRV